MSDLGDDTAAFDAFNRLRVIKSKERPPWKTKRQDPSPPQEGSVKSGHHHKLSRGVFQFEVQTSKKRSSKGTSSPTVRRPRKKSKRNGANDDDTNSNVSPTAVVVEDGDDFQLISSDEEDGNYKCRGPFDSLLSDGDEENGSKMLSEDEDEEDHLLCGEDSDLDSQNVNELDTQYATPVSGGYGEDEIEEHFLMDNQGVVKAIDEDDDLSSQSPADILQGGDIRPKQYQDILQLKRMLQLSSFPLFHPSSMSFFVTNALPLEFKGSVKSSTHTFLKSGHRQNTLKAMEVGGTVCWWDHHKCVQNRRALPISRRTEKDEMIAYYVFLGCFCSWECAHSFQQYYLKNKFYHLLLKAREEIDHVHSQRVPLRCHPFPYVLKRYGGSVSIDVFRHWWCHSVGSDALDPQYKYIDNMKWEMSAENVFLNNSIRHVLWSSLDEIENENQNDEKSPSAKEYEISLKIRQLESWKPFYVDTLFSRVGKGQNRRRDVLLSSSNAALGKCLLNEIDREIHSLDMQAKQLLSPSSNVPPVSPNKSSVNASKTFLVKIDPLASKQVHIHQTRMDKIIRKDSAVRNAIYNHAYSSSSSGQKKPVDEQRPITTKTEGEGLSSASTNISKSSSELFSARGQMAASQTFHRIAKTAKYERKCVKPEARKKGLTKHYGAKNYLDHPIPRQSMDTHRENNHDISGATLKLHTMESYLQQFPSSVSLPLLLQESDEKTVVSEEGSITGPGLKIKGTKRQIMELERDLEVKEHILKTIT